jgi:alpha-1,3-rhamnosyltransferase
MTMIDNEETVKSDLPKTSAGLTFEQSFPLVTVIIPAYNHEKYIEECLNSVCAQTYNNLQIIVINDGSKDNTGNIIRKFIEDRDAKIEYIEKENEGICKTLNLGLLKANGKYIALLASDDFWMPTRVEEQVMFLERNEYENKLKIGLVYTDAYFVKGNTITQSKYSDYKPGIRKYFTDSIQNRNLFDILMVDNIIIALTVLIRKECFDKVGNFDISLKCEDLDMWLRISKEYEIAYIDKPLAYYRIHGTNVSGSASVMIRENLKTIAKQFKSYPLKRKPLKAIILFFRFCARKIINKIVKREITT